MDKPAVGVEGLYPRQTSRGRTFVYVLPCREEDILKVGFSRDPLQRLRSLHRRFFDFFDLERAFLIETDHLRDARAIEQLLITGFTDHRAPAPLVVPRAVAGHTECSVACRHRQRLWRNRFAGAKDGRSTGL